MLLYKNDEELLMKSTFDGSPVSEGGIGDGEIRGWVGLDSDGRGKETSGTDAFKNSRCDAVAVNTARFL